MVQTQGKGQLGARRRLNMLDKGAAQLRKGNGRRLFGSEIVNSLARNLQSSLKEMIFLPLFLRFFPFSVARFPVGKTPVSCLVGATPVSCLAGATPVPHEERRASVALICLHCSKEGMCILAKQSVSSERCAMPKGVLYLSSWQQTQQLQTKLSL